MNAITPLDRLPQPESKNRIRNYYGGSQRPIHIEEPSSLEPESINRSGTQLYQKGCVSHRFDNRPTTQLKSKFYRPGKQPCNRRVTQLPYKESNNKLTITRPHKGAIDAPHNEGINSLCGFSFSLSTHD